MCDNSESIKMLRQLPIEIEKRRRIRIAFANLYILMTRDDRSCDIWWQMPLQERYLS